MCESAVVTLHIPCSEIVWRVLAIHSIRPFPLHSRASPCVITFQLDSTHVFKTAPVLYGVCSTNFHHLVLHSHIHLGFPNSFFPSDLSSNTFVHFSLSSFYRLPHVNFFNIIILISLWNFSNLQPPPPLAVKCTFLNIQFANNRPILTRNLHSTYWRCTTPPPKKNNYFW